MGWDVDVVEYDKGGDFIWLRDLERRMLQVSYNATNGRFKVFTPFSQTKPTATHDSEKFEGCQWYDELLALFYEDIPLPKPIHIFKVNDYVVAAEAADRAFWCYLITTDNMNDVPIRELGEGDEDSVTITIKRLPQNEIEEKVVPYCDHGCDRCAATVYMSYQELADQWTNYPRVIAKII